MRSSRSWTPPGARWSTPPSWEGATPTRGMGSPSTLRATRTSSAGPTLRTSRSPPARSIRRSAAKITSPSPGAVATTSATVTGIASRATLVQVRVGSAVWTNAMGVASWTITFDLSPFPNGPIVFEARAFNGTVESAHDSITIQKAPAALALDRCTGGSNVTANLIVVRGTSAHADAVQVRAGTGSWSAVAGSLDGWSAQLDLSGFANMQAVAIEARAFNGSAESTHDQIYVVKVLPLVVLISYPAERAQVSGTLTVTGTTTAGSTVQIRFDGGLWVNASTIGSTWSYRIDTTTTFDGDHLIEAQAVWGSTASPVVARNVVVSNSKPPGVALPQPPFWGLAVAILLAGVFLALLLVRRRRRGRAASDAMPRRRPPVQTSSSRNLERR